MKKAVSKLSTKRNTLKRQLRVVVLEKISQKSGIKDYVFVYKGTPTPTHQELIDNVEHILAMVRD